MFMFWKEMRIYATNSDVELHQWSASVLELKKLHRAF